MMFDILIITLSYCFEDSFLVEFRGAYGADGGTSPYLENFGVYPPPL